MIFLIFGANGLILLLVVILIVAIILSNRKKDPDISVLASQCNKVVNVPLTGGIIGALSGSPRNSLNSRIQAENANGWRVVQVLPADSGNLFLIVLRFILLLFTLFLYTTSNGYYVIMERKTTENQKETGNKIPDIQNCTNCGKEYSLKMKGYFCDECGHKI